MELNKLVERLEELTGERIPENTVKKWAHTEKIIPTPIGGGKGGRVSGGKARKADWPAPALEQAAAVWWVREKYHRMYGEEKKGLSKDQINVIKRAASVLDESPFAIYHLPLITGPLSTQHIAPEAITMTFVNDDFDGINLFLSKKKLQEKTRCLNTLVIAWVAAREKYEHGKPMERWPKSWNRGETPPRRRSTGHRSIRGKWLFHVRGESTSRPLSRFSGDRYLLKTKMNEESISRPHSCWKGL